MIQKYKSDIQLNIDYQLYKINERLKIFVVILYKCLLFILYNDFVLHEADRACISLSDTALCTKLLLCRVPLISIQTNLLRSGSTRGFFIVLE